jgi:hypothetical protein
VIKGGIRRRDKHCEFIIVRNHQPAGRSDSKAAAKGARAIAQVREESSCGGA